MCTTVWSYDETAVYLFVSYILALGLGSLVSVPPLNQHWHYWVFDQALYGLGADCIDVIRLVHKRVYKYNRRRQNTRYDRISCADTRGITRETENGV